MKKEVLIASDSTSDLSPELLARYNIKTIPLGIVLGDKQYRDGIDIQPDDIYAHYSSTGELPKTSAVNVTEFSEFFARHTSAGKSIVLFTISSEMSSTFNNARIAAQEFPDVYVVDSRNLSTGAGLLVIKACEMAAQGMEAADIASACANLTGSVDVSFVVDDLEFLYKGGRCSSLAALGANLLQIKPGIVVRDGRMGVGGKYRGKYHSALKKYIQEQLADTSGIDLSYGFVVHAGCDPELVDQCAEQVKSLVPFEQIHIIRAGCTISSHCGRNTLGIIFMRK